MRVKTPYSGLEVECSVFADDHECSEFMLVKRPTSNNEPQPLKECYVPVHDGQILSITGHLSGRLARARFDLIADGSFVGTRLVESDHDGQPKQHNRRRIEFRVINTVAEVEPGEKETTAKVVEGQLLTQTLDVNTDERYLRGHGEAWGVGSLVVIVSAEETYSSQGYEPDRNDYPDRLLGNWEYRPDNVRDSGVPPTHCLGVTNVSRNVIPQKCNKFFATFEGTRYGTRPVAKFVFYYRSKAAIHTAKCMPCPNKAYPVREEHEELTPIRSEELESPVSAEDDASAPLFMASADDQPEQPKRKKLGGTLTLPKAYRTIEQDPKPFQQLITDQEIARQQNNPSALSRERQTTTTQDDSIGAAVAASRTVIVAGRKYVMLSIRSINDLMLKEGMPLAQLVNYVFKDLPKEDRTEAARILIQHLHGFAVVVQNKEGRKVCFRVTDLPKDAVAKRQAKLQDSPDPLEPPHKRIRTHTAPQPVQRIEPAAPRNEAKRQAMERIQRLREAQQKLAEEEAAALAELSDEDVGRDDAQELVGDNGMQENNHSVEPRPRVIHVRQQIATRGFPHALPRIPGYASYEYPRHPSPVNALRGFNMQAVGYYQPPASAEDEAAEDESDVCPEDSDDSYKP